MKKRKRSKRNKTCPSPCELTKLERSELRLLQQVLKKTKITTGQTSINAKFDLHPDNFYTPLMNVLDVQ